MNKEQKDPRFIVFDTDGKAGERLCRALQQSAPEIRTERVEKAAELPPVIARLKPDALIYAAGPVQGARFTKLKEVREGSGGLPIIVAEGDLDSGIDLFGIEAADRVASGDRARLGQALRGVFDQRRAAEVDVRLAWTDPLTGMANRRRLLDRLSDTAMRWSRSRTPFAVLALDLDHFKEVNDTFGHAAGDHLLRIVGTRLRKALRQTDTVARLGGDEFVIVQNDIADANDAGALAAKILKTVAAPIELEGSRLRITTSIGIFMSNSSREAPEAMLEQADLALYQAKLDGRNRFCFHSRQFNEAVRASVAVAEELRSAIARDELTVYFQPQVELPSGRIVGLEALLRWNHPVKGVVEPKTFMAIAEKTGIAPQLDRWVVDQVCRQIRAWQEAGITPPVVAINLSGSGFQAGNERADELRRTLAQYELSPSAVELEFSETILSRLAGDHAAAFDKLSKEGFGVSIDDFGTGYSSLDKLTAYPLTALKIAQPLAQQAPLNRGKAAILRVVVALARELGLRVIAEAVETDAQVAFLIEAGCTVAQGYRFYRPMPADAVSELLGVADESARAFA